MGLTQYQLERGNNSYSTCCVCKKQVYTGMSYLDQWAYKKGKLFCCSYSCYLKANGLARKFK